MPDEVPGVPFARVGRPHALRGECRLYLFHPQSPLAPRLPELDGLILAHPELGTRPVRLASTRGSGGDFLIAQFEGFSRREAIEGWTHAVLHVPEHLFEPLEEGEFYAWQLAGLALVSEAGENLGTVLELVDFGGGDLLAVRYRGREEFVPFAEPWVGPIDLMARTVVLRPGDLFDEAPTRPGPSADGPPEREG